MLKVLLDLDTGIDDALALAYALASDELDVIGVCTSYGNVREPQATVNTLSLLDFLGRSDIPVYAGATHPEVKESFSVAEASQKFHGINGIGNVYIPFTRRHSSETSAVDAIIECAHTYQDDFVYIPTGPLTNLAKALKKDPSIADCRGRVICMGGALCVPGNVTPCAEANIYQDPEAANEVMRSGMRFVMVGLDVTLQTFLTAQEIQVLRYLGTAQALAYADMAERYLCAYEHLVPYLKGCALHDPLAVAVAEHPDLVECLPMNLKVDLKGELRGRTIGDELRRSESCVSSQVAIRVDAQRFLSLFMEHMERILR